MRHKPLLPLFAAVVLAGLDCASLVKKAFDPPKVAVDRVEFKDISFSGCDLVLHIRINNPNGIGATLNRLEYAFDADGERLLSGKKEDKTTIKAKAISDIPLPLRVSYSGLRKGVAGVLTKKVLPFRFTGKVVLDTPIGDLGFDLNHEGEIPIPDRPRFELTKIALAEFSVSSATLMLHLRISNNHDLELDIRQFRYQFLLQDSLVSASEIQVGQRVPHDKSLSVALPITLKLLSLKRGIVDMLRSGQLRYVFHLELDLSTRYGAVTIPYEQEGLSVLY